jgi:6-phosphogluconate dehydrogenase
MEKADIGLIGLAVMGQNLVLNMNDHGFKVAVFNRTISKVDDFMRGSAKGNTFARRADQHPAQASTCHAHGTGRYACR